MKNESLLNHLNNLAAQETEKVNHPDKENRVNKKILAENELSEILVITPYSSGECGVAIYSKDLLNALNRRFDKSFQLSLCALESEDIKYPTSDEREYTLNTAHPDSFIKLASHINKNSTIRIVLIEYDFELFGKSENDFRQFLETVTKPIIITFHTILPQPDEVLKLKVQQLINLAESIVAMTKSSAAILVNDYETKKEKITVIPHGTFHPDPCDKRILKDKYNLSEKKILSTIGMLDESKGLETTLEALPAIIEKHKDVLFLIVGKTHPALVVKEKEKYREKLEARVAELKLQEHVKFMNCFLPQPVFIEFLQLTDIYLFTSNSSRGAVSGMFRHALACGCPVVCSPVPHAFELVEEDAGIIIDFEKPQQLSDAVIKLLDNEQLRISFGHKGLIKLNATSWENTAISHALLFEKITKGQIILNYTLPDIQLNHIKKLTTDFGIIQSSKFNEPDMNSGYTLNDNARALVALCMHYESTRDPADIEYISIYFNFIKFCLQPEGYFLNYVSKQRTFTTQNNTTNLADANGRAIWALGYLISLNSLLPIEMVEEAKTTMNNALAHASKIYSTRAMAFVIKGLHYRNLKDKSLHDLSLIKELANRLVQMYRHETENDWDWFESYFTYSNSLLPEALLCAWLATDEISYKEVAKSSFDFLISKTFYKNSFKVISNKGWLHKGDEIVPVATSGELPVDVTCTITALKIFYDVFQDKNYKVKMDIAFNWFLGSNHLNRVIYNSGSGGCYDCLEENYVHLNQGAEASVSYLIARLAIGKTFEINRNPLQDAMKINKPAEEEKEELLKS